MSQSEKNILNVRVSVTRALTRRASEYDYDKTIATIESDLPSGLTVIDALRDQRATLDLFLAEKATPMRALSSTPQTVAKSSQASVLEELKSKAGITLARVTRRGSELEILPAKPFSETSRVQLLNLKPRWFPESDSPPGRQRQPTEGDPQRGQVDARTNRRESITALAT